MTVKKIKLDPNVATSLSHKQLQKTAYAKPDFSASTAEKVLFGMLGGLSTIHAGNKIIEKNNVKDPAQNIANKFSNTLAAKFKLVVTEIVPKNSKSDNIVSLVNSHSEANILLDVKTLGWGLVYFPLDWNSYRVIYRARLRLIDTSTRIVIAEDLCHYAPEYADDAPSYRDLVDQNAAGLKSQLKKATDFCLKYFNENIFSL